MRILFSFSFLILASFLPVLKASAQDTIMLINGKKINANVLQVQEKSIKYRTGGTDKKKIHSIKPYRVFAINKSDGTEELIFKPDSLDEPEFNLSQFRMFIKGEQAAQTGYNNKLNKVVAFVLGAAASNLDIYGLIVPALYSSIVGSVSPDINKLRNADPALINNVDYQEGYLKVVRDKKIRNSFVAGMIGFATGFAAQAIIGNNTRK
jgi:hypothetical protein